MENILYKNSATDIRLKEMVDIMSSNEEELPNLIILTIQSAGAGVGTPIFNKEPSEIGTKFILDGEEITSDDFLVVTKSQYGMSFNFFGLLFEDANEHTLKVGLIDSTIPNFQRITAGSGCSSNSITSVIISNSITSIGDDAFSYCTGLTNITIPDSVTEIGQEAFRGCTGLTSINIPDSVTEIGRYAFFGCSGLTEVSVGSSVTTIGDSAFVNCNGITLLTWNAVNCQSYTMSSGNIEELVIGNRVQILPSNFASSSNISSVIIPDSVTTIGSNAFYNCSDLESIISSATIAPSISFTTFRGVKTNGTLHVPAGSDYSAWMSSSDYYLGTYNWTKVEDA